MSDPVAWMIQQLERAAQPVVVGESRRVLMAERVAAFVKSRQELVCVKDVARHFDLKGARSAQVLHEAEHLGLIELKVRGAGSRPHLYGRPS